MSVSKATARLHDAVNKFHGVNLKFVWKEIVHSRIGSLGKVHSLKLILELSNAVACPAGTNSGGAERVGCCQAMRH